MCSTLEQLIIFGDDRLQVTVSTAGGELQSLKTADGCQWLWQGDETYWSDRAPNLFPYVGRLWQEQYHLGEETYPMTIHGFLHHQQLRVETQKTNAVTLVFTDTPETRTSYPFAFLYAIDYTVTDGRLCITYRVENRDTRPLYFGLGGHPGFQVPLEEGLSFEDYRLEFQPGALPIQVGFSEQCFRNGKDHPFYLKPGSTLPLTHDLFDQDAVVLSHCGHTVRLASPKGSRAVEIFFPQMLYLGIWHRPHTDAPYVCLEPWASLPSFHGAVPRLEAQSDLITLQPGEIYSNTWSISCLG